MGRLRERVEVFFNFGKGVLSGFKDLMESYHGAFKFINLIKTALKKKVN